MEEKGPKTSPDRLSTGEGTFPRHDGSGFATLLGPRCTEAGEGRARVVLDTRGMENLFGSVHGGAVFALADHAFGAAANAAGGVSVALSARISYLVPAVPGKDLEAVAERTGGDGPTSFYRVEVRQDGQTVAIFHGTAYYWEKKD